MIQSYGCNYPFEGNQNADEVDSTATVCWEICQHSHTLPKSCKHRMFFHMIADTNNFVSLILMIMCVVSMWMGVFLSWWPCDERGTLPGFYPTFATETAVTRSSAQITRMAIEAVIENRRTEHCERK